MAGDFEVFYTNPPYGASNRGASVLAFLCRGLDLVGPAGEGYLVYPEFSARAWAANALHNLNTALGLSGWTLALDSIPPRRYHLDDDPDLASVTHHLIASDGRGRPLPWTHRTLTDIDLPYFYGRSTLAPYPSEILCPTFNATPQPNHVHNFNALHLDFSS